MRAYVQPEQPSGLPFMEAAGRRLVDYGFDVVSEADGGIDLAVLWNGRGWSRDVPVLYVERGWLPRWEYQVSHTGINAASHLAGATIPSLRRHEVDATTSWLEGLRGKGVSYRFADASPNQPQASGLPERFVLVPLQDDRDTNMQHAPEGLRTARELVAWVRAQRLPFPVIYKLHPALRAKEGQAGIEALRRGDQVRNGPVHGFLRHPGCVAVVTINSNVSHDALVWGVPVVTLGRGIWPVDGPFYSALPDDWQRFERDASKERRTARIAYAAWLRRAQWTPRDLVTPRFVAAIGRALAQREAAA